MHRDRRDGVVRLEEGVAVKIIDERLLDEFRAEGCCELCRCFAGRREPHHIFAKGMGGGGRLDVRINLLGLCWICHCEVHNGQISRDACMVVVSNRDGMTCEAIQEEIWRLRRAKKSG